MQRMWIAREQANGDVLISARRNRLIVEERLPIPVTRRQLIQKEEEVENRWVFGIDNRDRDGFFVGRNLKPIELTRDFTLSLEPQLMVQRANNGETSSYPAEGESDDSEDVDQPTTADLFGLKAELKGQLWDWDITRNADISSFQPAEFCQRQPLLGQHRKRFRAALDRGRHRPLVWRLSLPHLEWLPGRNRCLLSLGGFIEQTKGLRLGQVEQLLHLACRCGQLPGGELQQHTASPKSLRANFYGSINSVYPIWRGKKQPL